MWAMEVQPGILAGRLSRPIDRVGCYIPGGLAAYPSSALMNIIPAKVAGVAEIVAATPPGPGMAVNPATLVAAHLAGASQLFKIGGPWAIGSLAYGTQDGPPGGQDRGAGQQVCHRGQAFGVRPGGHRLPGGTQRGPDPGG